MTVASAIRSIGVRACLLGAIVFTCSCIVFHDAAAGHGGSDSATNDNDRSAIELFVQRRRERIAAIPPADTPPRPPTTDIPGHNEVDAFIIAAWERANLPESFVHPDLCDDMTFVRRVYLDVIGRIPTLAELNEFHADTSTHRRARLIDALLSRDQEYADHWTAFWEDALASSTVAVNGGMATRGNSTRWINDAFRANTPFDLFAARLLDPSLPGAYPIQMGSDNGQPVRAHFVLNRSHTDTLQTAAAVAQVFMGTAMKCAACHNHFENNEWPQRRFLAFAGLFNADDLEIIRCESRTGITAPAQFPFALAGMQQEIPQGENARLAYVARMVVDPLNPRFARSIVNRLWKRFLGLGLFEPADDWREDISPSHPDLLAWLADDLIQHEFDLKRTIRLILNSRTYQLRFDAARVDTFDAADPHAMRWFRSPSLRRMTAEQFIDSAHAAMRQTLPTEARAFRRTESTPLTRALGKPAMRNDVSTARSDEPAILQCLELLNGEELQRIIASGRLVQIAEQTDHPDHAVGVLVNALFGRAPSDHELRLLADHLSPAWHAQPELMPAETMTWLDSGPPLGATLHGPWKWLERLDGSDGTPQRAHVQDGATSPRAQHLFHVQSGWNVSADDLLWVEVWIDPDDPPREIMLQWNDGGGYDGGWAHRAFWGDDVIPFGVSGTDSRRRIGDLPLTGTWIRLEIPAHAVGFGDHATRVTGMSFDQAGGTVHWGRTGIVTTPPSPRAPYIHDVLWTLVASTEFQFIR